MAAFGLLEGQDYENDEDQTQVSNVPFPHHGVGVVRRRSVKFDVGASKKNSSEN